MSRQGFGRSLTLITLTQAGSISWCCLGLLTPARGQIVRDRTLGAESSVITPNVNIRGIPSDQIDGGAIRGTSLFHSFSEFNISEGQGAYFTNPAGIENILSRVTGTSPSNIGGTLGVLGNANLFLINPNGIIFGSKAKLDVGGSFVASTASTLKLLDGTQFSATNPSALPLLTVSIPVGLQYRGNEGNIQVQGLNSQLSVPNGETLALVGGAVNLESVILLAPGGRVELGGLAQTGTVGLNIDSNDLGLSFPDGVTRSDVSLSNKAVVTVAAGGGGSIALNARNLALLESSALLGGIQERSGSAGSVGGDITINATENIKVENSGIFADVPPQSVGKAGAINITTGSLYLIDGARVSSSTRGQGDAGRVTITARDTIAADGVSLNGFSAGVFSSIGPGAVGRGGSVNITTGSLSLTNGAQVTAATRGQGDAGSVTITARDTLVFDGVGSNRSSSGAFSSVSFGGVGKGGDVNVTTSSLSLTNGAEVSASTFGRGNAGNVTITARDFITSDGVGSNGFSSGAFSYVGASAQGNGGDVNVTTGSIYLTNGALVSASTFGRGNAGNVTILATGILDFDGVGSKGYSSGVSSIVGEGARGNGGDIKITTGSLFLSNGAQVSAGVSSAKDTNSGGQGNGGSIQVNSDAVNLVGAGFNGVSSGLYTSTGREASGNAGNIVVNTNVFRIADGAVVSAKTLNASNGGNVTINANTFTALNGAQVITSTGNDGNAGDINLNVTDNITLSGGDPTFATRLANFGNDTVNNETSVSGLFASTAANSRGNGGSIVVNSTELAIAKGATLSVSSLGAGNAGNMVVETNSILLDQGKLTAESTAGKGGDIQLKVEDLLLLRRNSLISAISGTAGSDGRDGNINIDTQLLVAIPSENSDIIANGFGRSVGSNIQVNAQGIFGTQFRQQLTPESDIVATGTVNLNTPSVDPSNGLVALPETVVDPAALVGQNPCERGKGSEFIVTGRGGLPSNPSEALSSDATHVGLVEPASSRTHPSTTTKKEPPTHPTTNQIMPAQGWVFNDKGQVVLTASNPISTGTQRPWANPDPCKVP